jgi:hypothetical protein
MKGTGLRISKLVGLAVIVLSFAATPAARAQGVVEGTEELDFDRPEAWGMKYFASLSLLTGMGVPERMGGGGFALGFEGGFVPQLSDEQRRIGFDGTKLEDVNKTKFFGRLRAAVGLSDNYTLDIGYTPPFEVGGATPHLFAVGIGRPFDLSESWRLGLRAYGQFGTIDADITCSADEVAAGPDPELNPLLCEEPSDDRLKQKLIGGELSVGYFSGRWRPYAGAAVNYMDLDFQVNARYDGLVDSTLQLTDGVTFSVTTGLGVTLSESWYLSGELFYSWLSINRPPPGTPTENDGFLNGRFLVAYRFR